MDKNVFLGIVGMIIVVLAFLGTAYYVLFNYTSVCSPMGKIVGVSVSGGKNDVPIYTFTFKDGLVLSTDGFMNRTVQSGNTLFKCKNSGVMMSGYTYTAG